MDADEAFVQLELLRLELTEELDEPLERLVVPVDPDEVDPLERLLLDVVVPLVAAFGAALEGFDVPEPDALKNAGERRDTDSACDEDRVLRVEDVARSCAVRAVGVNLKTHTL